MTSAGARCWLLVAGIVLFAARAEAYVDPSVPGMLYQVLYVLFYGMIGALGLGLRRIGKLLGSVSRILSGRVAEQESGVKGRNAGGDPSDG